MLRHGCGYDGLREDLARLVEIVAGIKRLSTFMPSHVHFSTLWKLRTSATNGSLVSSSDQSLIGVLA
jgi:hypothetical protein